MTKKAIREYLFQHQDGKCVLCSGDFGEKLDLYDIMRKIPPRKGGGYEIENLQLVHPKCRENYQQMMRNI